MGAILRSQHAANRPQPSRLVDVKILQVNFLRNQPFIAVILILSFFSFPACSSRSGPPDTRYVPAGDLLDIVKDFQRLAKEDTYRFPIPKDVTGVNIMRLGVGRALLGVVVAELMAANAGLGYLLRDSSETWDSPKLFVTVILLATIGLVSFNLIKRLEQKMAPWRQSAEWTTE